MSCPVILIAIQNPCLALSCSVLATKIALWPESSHNFAQSGHKFSYGHVLYSFIHSLFIYIYIFNLLLLLLLLLFIYLYIYLFIFFFPGGYVLAWEFGFPLLPSR